MNIIHTFEKEQSDLDSIFLAGPTLRIPIEGMMHGSNSWRWNAIGILKSFNFLGNIYFPEWLQGIRPKDWTYSRQLDWENDCLNKAKVILFWIPRDMKLLPGLTTNIEFGEWMKSGKIVAGAPNTAEHIQYIREKCSRNNIPWADTLGDCIRNALDKLSELTGKKINLLFTADTHFGSQRTLELSRRPFNSVREMDWAMVKGWNEMVGDDDIVYHLGDFGDPSYLKYLKGKQIFFLSGNYDNSDVINEILKDKRIRALEIGADITLSGCRFRLVHEPVYGSGLDKFFLFGHIHNLQMVKKNGLNVGVDCHHFRPISTETVLFYQNAILKHYDKNVFMEVIG